MQEGLYIRIVRCIYTASSIAAIKKSMFLTLVRISTSKVAAEVNSKRVREMNRRFKKIRIDKRRKYWTQMIYWWMRSNILNLLRDTNSWRNIIHKCLQILYILIMIIYLIKDNHSNSTKSLKIRIIILQRTGISHILDR